MIPGAVRVTTRAEVDRGRPPTTLALLVDALARVANEARMRDDITAFSDLAQAMPTAELQALLDSRPPMTQWVERCIVQERRRAIAAKMMPLGFDEACALATAVLRGELWVAS